jgi:hypothetical protein
MEKGAVMNACNREPPYALPETTTTFSQVHSTEKRQAAPMPDAAGRKGQGCTINRTTPYPMLPVILEVACCRPTVVMSSLRNSRGGSLLRGEDFLCISR